jgi:hypothetical protein
MSAHIPDLPFTATECHRPPVNVNGAKNSDVSPPHYRHGCPVFPFSDCSRVSPVSSPGGRPDGAVRPIGPNYAGNRRRPARRRRVAVGRRGEFRPLNARGPDASRRSGYGPAGVRSMPKWNVRSKADGTGATAFSEFAPPPAPASVSPVARTRPPPCPRSRPPPPPPRLVELSQRIGAQAPARGPDDGGTRARPVPQATDAGTGPTSAPAGVRGGRPRFSRRVAPVFRGSRAGSRRCSEVLAQGRAGVVGPRRAAFL